MADNSPAPATIMAFSDLPQSDSSACGPCDASLPKTSLPALRSLLGMEISAETQNITVVLLQECFLPGRGKLLLCSPSTHKTPCCYSCTILSDPTGNSSVFTLHKNNKQSGFGSKSEADCWISDTLQNFTK